MLPRGMQKVHQPGSIEAPPLPDHAGDARPAKRQRITIACTCCRQRKSRCDGVRPKCSTCSEHGSDCVYANSLSLTKSAASKNYIDGLEARLSTLESCVTGLATRVNSIEGLKSSEGHNIEYSPRHSNSTLATHDFGCEASGETTEVQDPTDGIGSIIFSREEDSGFFGPSSNIAFTRHIVKTTTTILKDTASNASPSSPQSVAMQSHMLHVSRPASPKQDRITLPSRVTVGREPFILPPTDETILLIELYFSTTGVLFPYIDQRAFQETYQQLKSTSMAGIRRSWLGLLNMVLAMSTSAGHDTRLSAVERAAQSDIFFRRAFALCEKQIRHGTSLEVVQMLLLMSQYLQGTERSIETWNVHGLAVKAAYHLGIHSENALKQYPLLEREIRKRTWYGCVLLDRTLSMTMGRPSSIPETYVKLDVPRAFGDLLSPEATVNYAQYDLENGSTLFFTSTISLYKIMGEVVDVLYGSNLGCVEPDNVFEIASHLLRFEQKFFAWQRGLPESMTLVEIETVSASDRASVNLRFRIILTLRFLNLRILTHRPLLCKHLEDFSKSGCAPQQLATLLQVGTNSVRVCVQSALAIIKLMRKMLEPAESTRCLLGAWWFSLYYAFNAALVIYSTLLVQHQAQIHGRTLAIDDLDLSIKNLQEAVECLALLDKGNRMIEKCVRYTNALTQMLSSLYNSSGAIELHTGVPSFPAPINMPTPRDIHHADPHEAFDSFDANGLHIGMELSDIFGPSGFDAMPGLLGLSFTNNSRSFQ